MEMNDLKERMNCFKTSFGAALKDINNKLETLESSMKKNSQQIENIESRISLINKNLIDKTSDENGRNFVEKSKQYSSIEEFIKRDYSNGYVPIRSTTISEHDAATQIKMVPDIDGVVVEWNTWVRLTHSVRHIYMLPRDKGSLKPIYPVLKKHMPLHLYRNDSLNNLRNSFGTQLFYEHGWEYWLGFVPRQSFRPVKYEKAAILEGTYTSICELRCLFQKRLQNEVESRSLINTLSKNNLNDVTKLFVLPNDSREIVRILEHSVRECSPPPGFKAILISFRFGEKNNDPVQIPLREDNISDICAASIHVGSQILPLNEKDILWSRQGLQELIGQRGCLGTALTFYECANFQSNVDGRLMDVSPSLRRVCKQPENVRFIQLYVDTPHRYPQTKLNPVSGSIICNKAVHGNITKSYHDNAKKYISELDNNIRQLVKCVCRIEFVVVVTNMTTTRLEPDQFLDRNQLYTLLKQHALLVPFSYPGRQFTTVLRQVGMYLVQQLNNLFLNYAGTGNALAVWQSYQLELSIEKFLWGRPLSFLSNIWAINLGSGVNVPSRCKTDSLAFLALEVCTNGIHDEETTPPLSLWTSSDDTKRKIQTMFGFHDYVESAEHVIGRRTIFILLHDIHQQNPISSSFTNFLLGLKGTSKDERFLDGSVTLDQLGDILSQNVASTKGLVFPAAIEMLSTLGRNVKNILVEGAKEVNLKFFPALHVWDKSGNRSISWRRPFKFWRICPSKGGEIGADAYSSLAVVPFVLVQLENRKLLYSSKLKGLTFPWIETCLRKLKPKKPLSFEQIIICLTFFSCIAMFQNGRYVDFNKLARLVQDLPLSQLHFQALEILSKHMLPMNVTRIYRLHSSIPYKLEIKEKTIEKVSETKEDDRNPSHCPLENETSNDIVSLHDVDNDQDVVTVEARHRPTNYRGGWLGSELEIMYDLTALPEQLTWKQMYQMYTKKCAEQGLPDRTYLAFYKKCKRM